MGCGNSVPVTTSPSSRAYVRDQKSEPKTVRTKTVSCANDAWLQPEVEELDSLADVSGGTFITAYTTSTSANQTPSDSALKGRVRGKVPLHQEGGPLSPVDLQVEHESQRGCADPANEVNSATLPHYIGSESPYLFPVKSSPLIRSMSPITSPNAATLPRARAFSTVSSLSKRPQPRPLRSPPSDEDSHLIMGTYPHDMIRSFCKMDCFQTNEDWIKPIDGDSMELASEASTEAGEIVSEPGPTRARLSSFVTGLRARVRDAFHSETAEANSDEKEQVDTLVVQHRESRTVTTTFTLHRAQSSMSDLKRVLTWADDIVPPRRRAKRTQE